MKAYKTLLFLFLTHILFSQTDSIAPLSKNKKATININKLLAEGEKAYSEKNYVLAKEIYTIITDSVPWNQQYFYNLAATELSLGENENACENFYKIYLLNDMKVIKYLAEYCPNFKDENKYSFEKVEEKPKFIYKDKEYPLIQKNELHPKYLSVLQLAFKNSKILNEKMNDKSYFIIKINKFNELEGKVLRAGAKKEDYKIVETEIMDILKNMVTYVSAKNNGLNVALWDQWQIAIQFKGKIEINTLETIPYQQQIIPKRL